ncbi:MAG: tRNA glutamyl-Q(34) synthetase GluQRS [Rhodocyclaceae bacterium]|nr:tRNA glutamyl-Q(34) synthetase GluQRS [Rhodocyclaceae bacterium]MBX3667906.1 tRNA glutamyl-Q(34) synthetase GluQRS [Rhodocyclaceae bacterium]
MPTYCGRFAPSPSGPLHFGSLVAALGSWLAARAAGGKWLLRMEDIDTPRNAPGAADTILRQLECFGLAWDGPVLWQSRRREAYAAALAALQAAGRVFGCACTRREIADSQLGADGAPRYPGTCRAGLSAGRLPRAWRFRVEPGAVCFDDRLQGRQCQDVAADVGDFVLLRADGIYAYQLACVVDDAASGVTEVVRGADLLDSTPRQILLAAALGHAAPAYLHLPVAVDASGAKLSKQTLAQPVGRDPAAELRAALAFLGHAPAADMRSAAPAEVLAWARAEWNEARLPRTRAAGLECGPVAL